MRSNNFKDRPFINPISSLNERKDFRVDPKKARVVTNTNKGNEKAKRKNLTFNQLLSKFGYI